MFEDRNIAMYNQVLESFKNDVYQTLSVLSGFMSISELKAHVETSINKIYKSKLENVK